VDVAPVVALSPPEFVAPPISAYAIFMKSLKGNQEFVKGLQAEKGSFLAEAAGRWKHMND